MVRRCHAIGCRAEISAIDVFCTKHFLMVETDTRRVLAATFSPGRRPSPRFQAALSFAQREVLAYQTDGQSVRPPADFEFED